MVCVAVGLVAGQEPNHTPQALAYWRVCEGMLSLRHIFSPRPWCYVITITSPETSRLCPDKALQIRQDLI